MAKRYLLFKFENYYPGGGWNDYIGDFDTKDEAKVALLASVNDDAESLEGFEIVDLKKMQVVLSEEDLKIWTEVKENANR